MALDGAMLGLIGREIEEKALGAKVDKIHQPSREELVFVLRARDGVYRLLVSARANSPRVHFTESFIENPSQPPMLCMLLRKKLGGARLCGVRQSGSDRILMLDFDTVDELGDRKKLTMYVEVMARCSNAVLVSEEGNVIDSLRRVDLSMSSVRPVIPGMKYELPPPQDKLDLKESGADAVCERILGSENMRLDKAIMSAVMGISPIAAREIAWRTSGSTDPEVACLTEKERTALCDNIKWLAVTMAGENAVPTMLFDESGRPKDVTFFVPEQYGEGANLKSFGSFSEMLDELYSARDLRERMRAKEKAVLKTVSNACERISKKLSVQRIELEKAQNREELRRRGDMITGNIYRLKKGDALCDLVDYETGETVTVTLDPRLTPSQNAQKYYKEYAKAKATEQHLTVLISEGEAELAYLESTLDALTRASTAAELSEIKDELEDGGYIKRQTGAKKRQQATKPHEFISDDGFKILVGRNNRQNDRLTLKDSMKRDIWLHVTKRPGSHVVICTQGGEVPPKTIEQAAVIAAYYSSARDSGLTAVDFTDVRHVSKPNGAKPGMVIYTDQTTVFVKPDGELCKRLSDEGKKV